MGWCKGRSRGRGRLSGMQGDWVTVELRGIYRRPVPLALDAKVILTPPPPGVFH
jgi:hypothetical protein